MRAILSGRPVGDDWPVPARIRPATRLDLPSIAAIYTHEVQHGISTFDLEPPPDDYWEEKLVSEATGDHVLVAEDESGQVIGYAYSTSYRPRPAYRLTKEASVYLAPQARGRGTGRQLYEELVLLLTADGMHTVVALVALPNPASEALHRAAGFRHVGTLTEVGHKFGRWIDTAWFERRLSG
jgi:phosphinothricin acetyltransferase